MWYKPSANLRQGDMSFTAHYFRYSVLQSESYSSHLGATVPFGLRRSRLIRCVCIGNATGRTRTVTVSDHDPELDLVHKE